MGLGVGGGGNLDPVLPFRSDCSVSDLFAVQRRTDPDDDLRNNSKDSEFGLFLDQRHAHSPGG